MCVSGVTIVTIVCCRHDGAGGRTADLADTVTLVMMHSKESAEDYCTL